jgi:methylenetetrahydrofolate--tRNA-(uracil-5-)-methyltransferase
MKPRKFTPAHNSKELAELVCSNSLKSTSPDKASGILKKEMLQLDSLIINSAYSCQLPAGGALAVDRQKFSKEVSRKIKNNPLIQVIEEEVLSIEEETTTPTIIATGPLTSSNLSNNIEEFIGKENLSFYDSISPIVSYESLDNHHCFRASRYEENEGDYINCTLNESEYALFHRTLIESEKIEFHKFEKPNYFEGCLPIEVMAERGFETLRFGPMKPVGLTDPKTGKRPFAVVQLRKENSNESMWNLVGFQTKMKIKDQKESLSCIPALKKAEFLRFGSIHRNTYINSPGVILNTLQSQKNPLIFFAGQITGVEGYSESAAMGLIAGINSSRVFKNLEPIVFPIKSALGCLTKYISDSTNKKIQPMNINLGLFDIKKPKKNIEKIKKSSRVCINEINMRNQIELDLV